MKKKDNGKNKKTVAKIKVVGIGGAGGSAVKRMIKAKIPGIEYVVINTDIQALQAVTGRVKKVRIGKSLTKGLGTGSDPDLGQTAAEQDAKVIKEALKGADIIFLTAGLGGGVGTGAGPVVAELANQTKALTMAIVTMPFSFEGPQRRVIAEAGIKKLANRVDALMIISNNKLLQVIDKSTPILEAFDVADEVLKQGVKGISDILTVPGLVNVDFADVKPIIQQAGPTLLGIGQASGQGRAVQACRSALKNPLMNLSAKGAGGIVFIVTGSPDLKMMEVNEIAEMITKQVDPMARIVFGAVIDENLKDEIKITLIATGFGQVEDYDFTSQDLDEIEVQSEGDVFLEKSIKHVKRPSLSERLKKGKIRVYKNGEVKEERKSKGKKKKGLPAREKGLPAQAGLPNQQGLQFEDELEIPAFLRKKIK